MNLTCARKYDFYVFDLMQARVKACCKTLFLPHSKGIQDDLAAILNDRVDLEKGIQAPSCEACWRLENAGFNSFRSTESFSASAMVANEHQPYLVELLLGTKCNLRCIYCGPNSSSMWDQDFKTNKSAANAIPDQVRDFLAKHWDGIGMFNLVGGEPVLTPLTFSVLDEIRDLCALKPLSKKKRVKIVSNIATPSAEFERFLHKLQKFTDFLDIEVGVSAESLNEQFEYIRDGALFKVFDANLNMLLNTPKIDISLQSALNVLAMGKYHEFLEYFLHRMYYAKKTIHLNFNEVVFPRQLSPRNFPRVLTAEKERALAVLAKIPKNGIRNMSRFEEFQKSLGELYDSLGQASLHDTEIYLNESESRRLRTMNWKNIFPELLKEN